MIKRHRMFWLGFSVALGGILAVAVVAMAGPSGSPAKVAASTPGVPAAASMGALDRPATAADALPAEAAATAGFLRGSATSRARRCPRGLERREPRLARVKQEPAAAERPRLEGRLPLRHPDEQGAGL